MGHFVLHTVVRVTDLEFGGDKHLKQLLVGEVVVDRTRMGGLELGHAVKETQ